jgi:hypothetical protein
MMITIEFGALDLTIAENAVQNAFHCVDAIARQVGDDLVLHEHHGRTALAGRSAARRDLAATAVEQYARAAYELGRQNPNRGQDCSRPATQPITVNLDEETHAAVRLAVHLAAAQVHRQHQKVTDEAILHRHHDRPSAADESDALALLHHQNIADYKRVGDILDTQQPTTDAANHGALVIDGVVTAVVRAALTWSDSACEGLIEAVSQRPQEVPFTGAHYTIEHDSGFRPGRPDEPEQWHICSVPEDDDGAAGETSLGRYRDLDSAKNAATLYEQTGQMPINVAGKMARVRIVSSNGVHADFHLDEDAALTVEVDGREYVGVLMAYDDRPIQVVIWPDEDGEDNTTFTPPGVPVE